MVVSGGLCILSWRKNRSILIKLSFVLEIWEFSVSRRSATSAYSIGLSPSEIVIPDTENI